MTGLRQITKNKELIEKFNYRGQSNEADTQ